MSSHGQRDKVCAVRAMDRVSTITPPLRPPEHVNRDNLSPRNIENKRSKICLDSDERRDIVDIDEVQAKEDPNYNNTYAWSITRMKQDEEDCYIQRAPGDSGKEFSSNWSNNFPPQTDIDVKMHSTLVDWLVEEYGSYGVQTTAFCLCVHIMDEYLRRVADVPTYRFQLLGCVCLLIASKLEQTTCPHIDDLVMSSNYCFLAGDAVEMEREVLVALDYNVSLPTRIYFLNRFLLVVQMEYCTSSDHSSGSASSNDYSRDAIVERNFQEAYFCSFLLELTLQNFCFNQYPMSAVAAAIVHYMKQFYRPQSEVIWSPTLVFYTDYEEKDLIPVVFALQSFHSSVFNSELSAIVDKYSHRVSLVVALPSDQIRFGDSVALHTYLLGQGKAP